MCEKVQVVRRKILMSRKALGELVAVAQQFLDHEGAGEPAGAFSGAGPKRRLCASIRAIDDIFVQLAEAAALPVDDVVEELWEMLARGGIRLTVDDNRLRVELLPAEPTRGKPRRGQSVAKRPERMLLARRIRPIVEARWRVLEGRL